MSRNRVALVLSMLAIGVAPVAVAASVCKVQANVPAAARTFAKTSILSDWREYRGLDEVPNLVLDSGVSAQIWQDRGRSQSVTLVVPGQNFSMVTRYCFDSQGVLAGVGFEIRTPLGWGHRADGYVSGGNFIATSSEFFSLESGKVVPAPEGVSSVPRALQPVLYFHQSQLPFASLLTPDPKADAKARKHGRVQAAPSATESVAETPPTPAGI